MNDRGRQQAEALAGRLASIPLKKIYTSDLARAQETTATIRAQQPGEVLVVATPALRECSYGLWEGLTREEVASRFADEWQGWLKGGGIGFPPQGEDFASLARRAGAVFDAASREEGPVLISTHHGALQAILCHALGLDLTFRGRFLVTNCSLSGIECLQTPLPYTRLVLLNDTSHLAPLALASNRGTVLSSW